MKQHLRFLVSMLTRDNRLSHKKDFARLFSKGRSFYGQGMMMKVVANTRSATRVGFVVSTKVSKKAVVRNLLKRRMREIVKKNIHDILGGIDIVFLTKPEIAKFSFQELEQTLCFLLKKAGILRQ